jgi:hypothetical protein
MLAIPMARTTRSNKLLRRRAAADQLIQSATGHRLGDSLRRRTPAEPARQPEGQGTVSSAGGFEMPQRQQGLGPCMNSGHCSDGQVGDGVPVVSCPAVRSQGLAGKMRVVNPLEVAAQ